MSSRFPIWRRQDSGSNAAILENEKTLGTRLPDNHAVHTQTRDHGLYVWVIPVSKPCKNMESVQLRVNVSFGIKQEPIKFDGLSGACTHNFLNPPAYTSSLPYCICAGVGAKRLRTATVAKIQRLCLRNLWIAIPRESRRSHVQLTQKSHLLASFLALNVF